MPVNYLTIDVEDYFQVSAFESVAPQKQWDTYESRVSKNTCRLLDFLDSVSPTPNDQSVKQPSIDTNRANRMGDYARQEIELQALNQRNHRSQPKNRATFFVVGWIAERHPDLIKEIVARGHEIGCHGYLHRRIYVIGPEEFRKDTIKAKEILEDLTGKPVLGYRAPTYSITKKSLWALTILAELGFTYDSSIFPICHDMYGMPDAPRFPFVWGLNGDSPSMLKNHESQISNSEMRSLVEYPISTAKIFGQRIPIAGGGYFRLFPYWFTKWALKKINNSERQPFLFYLHPWEIDPEQPRFRTARVLSKFRHYNNLHKTMGHFKRLLRDFSFVSINSGHYALQSSVEVSQTAS
ncbi:MAG: DUF3473 domain-containing protein [Deltaproteobacteria bacterium]|nr:DUF3473 domain-containing protein [Deltaproteobacteria bacterium]